MLPEVNLLPKYERQNLVLFIVCMIGFIVSIILFAILAFFYFQTKGNLEHAEDHIQQLSHEKAILEAQQAPKNDENEAGSFMNAYHYAEHYIVPTSSFIDELIMLLPKNGYLNKYTYHYETVDIETQFEQMGDAAAYVQVLNGSEFITDIQVNEIETIDLADSDSEEVSDETVDAYEMIPRYVVTYSLHIDHQYMKEEDERDE